MIFLRIRRFRRYVVMGFTQQLPTSIFLGLFLGILYVTLLGVPFFSEETNCKFSVSNNKLLSKSNSLLEDDYEPIINLQSKPKLNPNVVRNKNPNVIRPRYYSTELNIKDKLLVIVLSSDYNSFNLYGKALNETLSNYVEKIIYFIISDKNSPKNEKYDNVVFLENVKFDLFANSLKTNVGVTSSSTNNAKASLLALKYVLDHYLKSYQYFYFIKDTTYVIGAKLEKFIQTLSLADEIHVGHVIDNNLESQCYLDSGILFSQNVLSRVAQQENIEWCFLYLNKFQVSSKYVTLDDSKIFEQCVTKATSVPCSKESYYLSLNLSEPQMSALRLWESGAISAFPIKNLVEHTKLTKYLRQRELNIIYDQISSIETRLSGTHELNQDKLLEYDSWPVGVQKNFVPLNRFDVIQWIYFNQTHILLKDDFNIVSSIEGINRLDIYDVMESCEKFAKAKYPAAELIEFTGGYRKFDSTRGMEYLLDFVFLDRGDLVSTRYKAIKPMAKTEIITVPYVTEHTRIVLALPVWSTHLDKAFQFVEDYANVCLKKKDNSVLVLLLLHNRDQSTDPNDSDKDNDPFFYLKSLANNLTEKYHSSNGRIAWMSVYLKSTVNNNFISDFAVLDLLVRKLTPDSLVLLCKPNMELRLEYLNRVRMNTIHGTQVFFPIPFIQFHPNLSLGYRKLKLKEPVYDAPAIEIKSGQGRFDKENFDHSSFYVFDYLTSRKAFEKEIPVAKVMKDLQKSLYYKISMPSLKEMFLRARLVHLMRAIEPDLRLYYENLDCHSDIDVFLKTDDDSLKEEKARIQQCVAHNWKNLGTKSAMASILLGNRNEGNSSAKEDYPDTE